MKNVYDIKNGTINGYTVVAIDGTKFFGSNKKGCPECLSNKNHCFHSGAVMSTVGDESIFTMDKVLELLRFVKYTMKYTNKQQGHRSLLYLLI